MEVDPYFILGVTRNSTLDSINKAFRQLARKFHPDRAKPEEREYYSVQFKLLKDAYTTIVKEIESRRNDSHKSSFLRDTERTERTERTDTAVVKQEKFNNVEFERQRKAHPNDFGYDTKPRLGESIQDEIDPSKVNWGAKMNEYNTFDYKPSKIIDEKAFNNVTFNRMFEKVRETAESLPSEERGLVEKTRDGFMAANSGMETGEFASVASWNGLMIVGDDFGQSGIGYDTRSFGDYRQSFMGGRNPDGPIDSNGFETKMERSGLPTTALSTTEQARLLRMRELESNQLLNTTYVKSYDEFNNECRLNEAKGINDKIKKDMKFIENYADIYPPGLLEQARQGQLTTSKDYIKQIDTSKDIEENMKTLGMFSTMRISEAGYEQ
jgi:curved DNA-binding protein CbpA